MRTRLLRTSVVGALALGLMAGGAAPAFADDRDDDAPVIESVSVTLPDDGRTWIKPGETATLEVVYTDKTPSEHAAVRYISDPMTHAPNGHNTYFMPMSQDLSADVPAPVDLQDGTRRMTLRYLLQPDAFTPYGAFWADGEQYWRIEVRDAWDNVSKADLPEVRVDDPEHPIATEASLSVSQGEPGRLFAVPQDAGQISVGDTLNVGGGAVGAASERVVWQRSGSDDAPELVSDPTVVTGNGVGQLNIGEYGFAYQATWPDGVVRSRSWDGAVGSTWRSGPLAVDPVYVNYGHVVLDRPAKVGGASTARFELSRADLPFSLGTPTFTWWVEGRKISGPSASFVPGDADYRVDATFSGVPPYAYAIDHNETRFSDSGSVGSGTMPDTAVTLGTAKVGSPLVATVGASKGASSVQAWWVVDGKDVTSSEVPVAGGKISWTPDARYLGKTVQVAVVRTYGTSSPTRTPRQLAPAKVTVGLGSQTRVSAPVLRGTVRVGSKVTLQQDAVLVPGAKRSIVWLKNGRVIPGATGWSYTPVAGDKGAKLSAKITVTAPGYAAHVSQAAAKSVAVGVLKRGQVGYFSKYQTVGETWRADVHGWDRGVTVKYQWLRDGKAIKKATASKYKLTRADRKHKVSLRITVSKAGYTSVTKTSNWNRVY